MKRVAAVVVLFAVLSGCTADPPAASTDETANAAVAPTLLPPTGSSVPASETGTLSIAEPIVRSGTPAFFVIGPSWPEGAWAQGTGWTTVDPPDWKGNKFVPDPPRIEGAAAPGRYIVRAYEGSDPPVYQGSAEVDVTVGEVTRVQVERSSVRIELASIETTDAALAGEPVTVSYRVTNEGDAPIELAPRLRLLGRDHTGEMQVVAAGEAAKFVLTFPAPRPPAASPAVQNVAAQVYLVGRLPWGDEAVASWSSLSVRLAVGEIASLHVSAVGRPDRVRTEAVVRVLDEGGEVVAREELLIGYTSFPDGHQTRFTLLSGSYRVELWATNETGAFWASQNITLAADAEENITLTRTSPYIVDVAVGPGDMGRFPTGSRVELGILVHNYDSVERKVHARLRLDHDQASGAPFEHEATLTATIPAGGEATLPFEWVAGAPGRYVPLLDLVTEYDGQTLTTSYRTGPSFEVTA